MSLSYVQSDFTAADLLVAKGSASVSVCLPARNEETTVRAIVRAIDRDLRQAGLVDEIVVVDDGSVDATAGAAASAGARVVASVGGPGKGQAMRTGLAETSGSIVVFCDADLYEFDSGFIVGLLGPLLTEPDVQFVKGFYRRPFGDRPDEGGRVTELVARPLLQLLCPQLAHIVQPLGGEYAGRRSTFEAVDFVDGYGVDVGLLIDIARRFGIDHIAQVDLGVRLHRNRPLHQLVPQSKAVMAAVLERAGVDVTL
ncbi:MAG: glucosyl-3-phosphoglycerate synthase [Actinobacteria bacterium]|nr:glucosyl-3-phosphoglycerate synthase [Actinomycetota bacterium]MBV8958697.1 glucosyl-3-phosphoglycerate synthase [Actinomycetota bacterium]MBV9666108.1 glucosyl-3-phosphoglycerate synthase [Actinomycetota bacterium]